MQDTTPKTQRDVALEVYEKRVKSGKWARHHKKMMDGQKAYRMRVKKALELAKEQGQVLTS